MVRPRPHYPNVWLGAPNSEAKGLWRSDQLRTIPAAIGFISHEPALGPLASYIELEDIDWVIYGGESGPGFRGHDLAWPRGMREACAKAGTAFFYKQSPAARTEMGITLDGELVRAFPTPR